MEQKLINLLNDMDVPELRKDFSNVANIRWLIRNLWIRNGDHPDIDEALILLTKIAKEQHI